MSRNRRADERTSRTTDTAGASRPLSTLRAAAMAAAVAVVAGAAALVVCAGAATPVAQAGVMRGIFDDTWVKAGSSQQRTIVADMAKLHVQMVRIDLLWMLAEPSSAGHYDLSYLGRIRSAVNAARAKGMKVMIDVYRVPRWASNAAYWNSPPTGYSKGYQPFYPIAASHLDEWQDTAGYLARYLKGKVAWWECWNEPNLWSYFYPQKTSGDAHFAARQYVKMLQRFSKAVNRADPATKVIGGVTSPFGMNDKMRTSPQRFAADLKRMGAAKYWDGYSHHPYTPAGSNPIPGPRSKPRFPQYTVNLANISTLLKIFPNEPFYLTEYGYPTKKSPAWGPGKVSEKTQAQYLTTAFRYAAGFRQVKMLTWFLWKDLYMGTPNDMGNAFFGLVRPNGTKKPSWSAFAKLK